MVKNIKGSVFILHPFLIKPTKEANSLTAWKFTVVRNALENDLLTKRDHIIDKNFYPSDLTSHGQHRKHKLKQLSENL